MQMKIFPVLGSTVKVDDGRINYNKYILEFRQKAKDAADKFRAEYNEKCDSIENVASYALNIGNAIIKSYLEECMQYIIGLGVYNISIEEFAEDYYFDNFYTFENEYQKIMDKYYDIVMTEEQKEEYRKMRKQNRGRWQGGGFGLAGALKGAATAGALNMASGAVHSMVNLGGRLVSGMAASIDKRNLYNDPNTMKSLVRGVRQSICNIAYALTNYINHTQVQKISIITNADIDEANTLMNNLKKYPVPEEKRLDLIIHILELNPYVRDAYIYLISNYGDARNEVENLADFFGVCIHDEKEKMLLKTYNEIKFDTEETTLEGKKELTGAMKHLGLEEAQVKELQEVNRILDEFDLQARTVDEVVFATREEAEAARQELEQIKKIYNKLDCNKEEEVINAKEEILKLELKTAIRDKYIDIIDKQLKELDLQARTYKEVVYDTREEAELHRTEWKMTEDIYKEMNSGSLQSVNEAYNKIMGLSLVTEAKGEYLNKIQICKEKILSERAKVLATFETVLSRISIKDRNALEVFASKVRAANVSSDIKEFVIEQIEKKIEIGE